MANRGLQVRLQGLRTEAGGRSGSFAQDQSGRECASRVLTYLADRRVLFNPYWREELKYCVQSVLEVRRMLTDEIGRLPVGDEHLVPHLEAIRSASRRFVDAMTPDAPGERSLLDAPYRELTDAEVPLIVGLGELRALVGVQVALLADAFDLDVPETLVEILPAPPDDGTDLDLPRLE